MRLDQYLIQNKLFPSRARAQEAIAAGVVLINGALAIKPAQKVAVGDEVAISGETHPFVSRGGVKLRAALDAFSIAPYGCCCLDLGASTGGFTDVLLRGGADRVYAVDVGHGQLHPTIAGDLRVVNLEKTHAKDLSTSIIPDRIDLIVCDVSFISLKKALPFAMALAAENARMAALVKPQFEVGPKGIGKGGIVKDGLAAKSVEDIRLWLADHIDWRVSGVIESPIKGGDGNKEYLIGAKKTA